MKERITLSFFGILRLVSHFVPIITNKIHSSYSGTLEITITNGRKYLNTAKVNYSYGTLQRVLEFTVRKVDLSGVKDILILGLGGGSIIKSLREVFNYQHGIVAVEIDPVIIEVAKNEFGIVADERTEILLADAYDYIALATRQFDLIIVDLFIEDEVPVKFFSTEFWKHIAAKVRRNGSVIFNSMSESESAMAVIKTVLGSGFSVEMFKKVEVHNHVMIARRIL